jgi:hypothetical protein
MTYETNPSPHPAGGARSAPRSRIRRVLLALGAVAVVAAAAVGTVSAASPAPSAVTAVDGHRFCVTEWLALRANQTVETLRAVGDCEINRRISTLNELDARVASAPQFTELHRNQLRKANNVNPASFEAEKTGLAALKTKIDGETDLSTLREDLRNIAEDFRVYLLVVPKAHLVGGADAIDKATDKLTEVAGKLGGLIEKAKANGKDVTRATALLDDLRSKTSQADSVIAGVADSIMPISPQDYNAGPGKTALETARGKVVQGRDLVKAARADAKQIIELLKA